MEESIYERLRAAGCALDNHESDLYVKLDATSREVLRVWALEGPLNRWSTFRSEVDGTIWADIAFRFEPFWTRRAAR